MAFAVPAFSQTFIYRLKVDPDARILVTPSITLQAGVGTGMTLDAAGAAVGVLVYGESRTFTFLNEAGAEVTISGFTLSNTTNFEISSDGCTGTLPDGGTCNVTVRFKATDNGSYSGTLQINAI